MVKIRDTLSARIKVVAYGPDRISIQFVIDQIQALAKALYAQQNRVWLSETSVTGRVPFTQAAFGDRTLSSIHKSDELRVHSS